MRRVRMTRLPALFLLLGVGACTPDGGDAEPIDLTAVSANLQGTAPDVFRARFETSKGDFVVEWSTPPRLLCALAKSGLMARALR